MVHLALAGGGLVARVAVRRLQRVLVGDVGIVIAFAVLVSLFVSFTLDPMLSSVWRDPDAEEHGPEAWKHAGPIRRIRDAAAAITYVIEGNEASYSLLGQTLRDGAIVDPVRVDWRPGLSASRPFRPWR